MNYPLSFQVEKKSWHFHKKNSHNLDMYNRRITWLDVLCDCVSVFALVLRSPQKIAYIGMSQSISWTTSIMNSQPHARECWKSNCTVKEVATHPLWLRLWSQQLASGAPNLEAELRSPHLLHSIALHGGSSHGTDEVSKDVQPLTRQSYSWNLKTKLPRFCCYVLSCFKAHTRLNFHPICLMAFGRKGHWGMSI